MQMVYVTRDIERALGISLDTPGYYIISNATPFAKSVASRKKNVLLIDEGRMLSTLELLQHPETRAHVQQNILVFKNTAQIERFCIEQGWQLLNPPAALAAEVEGKISQIEWLKDDAELLPLFAYGPLKNLTWPEEKCVLQFNTSHTGSGTHMLVSEKEFAAQQEQFPDRPARLLRFINGPVFTNNNVVTKGDTRIGNISYQITGLTPFTDNPFATVGNDWALGKKLVDEHAYHEIAKRVGARLQASGWKGAFGIDVMQDGSGKLWLIEINARQPASMTYESQLQAATGQKGMTTFEAHLLSLQGIESAEPLIRIDSGAQIVQRITPTIDAKKIVNWPQQVSSIQYSNTKLGEDLFRVQTAGSIMKAHNELGKTGVLIRDVMYEANT